MRKWNIRRLLWARQNSWTMRYPSNKLIRRWKRMKSDCWAPTNPCIMQFYTVVSVILPCSLHQCKNSCIVSVNLSMLHKTTWLYKPFYRLSVFSIPTWPSRRRWPWGSWIGCTSIFAISAVVSALLFIPVVSPPPLWIFTSRPLIFCRISWDPDQQRSMPSLVRVPQAHVVVGQFTWSILDVVEVIVS